MAILHRWPVAAISPCCKVKTSLSSLGLYDDHIPLCAMRWPQNAITWSGVLKNRFKETQIHNGLMDYFKAIQFSVKKVIILDQSPFLTEFELQ